MGSELVKPDHLDRKAVVYVRQSTQHQVIANQESLKLQYALSQRARDLGWREADIDVIDSDLGQSGAAAAHRRGFKDLVARVTLGEVGLILSMDVTRLARNCSDWYPLLDVCGHRDCLIADRDGIYDPGTPNGRLLLGLKGTISELELHTIRSRMTTGLIAKAERGDLALQLPAGLVRDPSGVVTKDPNIEVQERLLLFETFLKVRTAAQVMRAFTSRGLALPRRDRHGDLRWQPATVSAVTAMLKNPAYAGAFVYGRTWQKPSQIPGQRPQKSPSRGTDWRIVVRDKYPTYIDWGNLREDPGDAARQSRRVPAHQEPWNPTRWRSAAPRHHLLRRMRTQDDCALQGRQPIRVQSSQNPAWRAGMSEPARCTDRCASCSGILGSGGTCGNRRFIQGAQGPSAIRKSPAARRGTAD